MMDVIRTIGCKSCMETGYVIVSNKHGEAEMSNDMCPECSGNGRQYYEQEPPTDMDIWNDLQRQINALKEKQRWIPVSEKPQSWKNIFFVTCLTEEGRQYTGLAQYFGEKEKAVLEEDFIDDSCWGEESITEYDEENDCLWVKEGWFEFSLEGERAYRLSDPVIFYMALPEPPKEEE